MAYIGNIPAEKYQTLQKQSFTTSATDTYTLSYSVTNPQDLALFINNVRQNPNDAYTVSGTTLTLSSAITGSDTMYAVFLGRAVETIAPATGSVTNAMLAGSINESKLLGSIPTSKLADGSTFATTNGITMADSWRLTTTFSDDANPIASNLERVDTDGYGGIGTGMTESSGIFTFPSTGVYYITFLATASAVGGSGDIAYHLAGIQTTTDNSTYSNSTEPYSQLANMGSEYYTTIFSSFIFDVTNTTTHKVRFRINAASSSAKTLGDTGSTLTGMNFIRLGDT